jgi:hypothetical protein
MGNGHTQVHIQDQSMRLVASAIVSYHFPALHKGDIIEVNEGKNQLDFAYLGNVVQSIRKP